MKFKGWVHGVARRLLLIGGAALAFACMPPSGGGGGGDRRCDAGEVDDCRCPDGAMGVRRCGQDELFGACVCESGPGPGPGPGPGQGGGVVPPPPTGGSDGPGPGPGPGGRAGGLGGEGCVPDCADLECGEDPICGVLCGECVDGECVDGRCESIDAPVRITGLEVSRDVLYPEERLSVAAFYTGRVADGRLRAPSTGHTFSQGEFNPDGFVSFELLWEDVNAQMTFDFDTDGAEYRFEVTLTGPAGAEAQESFSVLFLCRGEGREDTPACMGTCAPSVQVGCVCAEDEPTACAGTQVVSCDGSFEGVDCSDYLNDGTVRGRCVEGIYGPGEVGCLMPTGQGCQFVSGEDETFYLPCGNDDGPDAQMACASGECRAGFQGCPVEGDAYCMGQYLAYNCLQFASGEQPLAADCREEAIGGPTARCIDDHCTQPAENGFCHDNFVRCQNGMECELEADGPAGRCVMPAAPPP